MKKLLTASTLALAFNSHALTEFHTGDVVTAEAMNGNFNELETRITNLEDPVTGEVNVMGNGVLIGTTVGLPVTAAETIQVKLAGYPGETVTLSADGSYTGFSRMIDGAITLNYVSDDCSGEAYYQVPGDSFWKVKALLNDYVIVRNGDAYQKIGGDYFKSPLGMNSTSDGGICTSALSGVGEVFRTVVDVDDVSPFAPVIEGPITIDGLVPQTYENLQEVY